MFQKCKVKSDLVCFGRSWFLTGDCWQSAAALLSSSFHFQDCRHPTPMFRVISRDSRDLWHDRHSGSSPPKVARSGEVLTTCLCVQSCSFLPSIVLPKLLDSAVLLLDFEEMDFLPSSNLKFTRSVCWLS